MKVPCLMIISGGQTGVDRAALDFAIDSGLPYGGWIPKGRRTEDGRLPDKYVGMKECPVTSYPARTRANVSEAHATVVFTSGPINDEPGCLLTVKLCKELQKPFYVINLEGSDVRAAADFLWVWLLEHRPSVLNVAGTRGSMKPDVEKVKAILKAALTQKG
jgi:hypothetical protein